MAVLPICIYGNRVLRKTAEEVKEVTPELATLAEDMLETMYEAPGIGLAAPQVGKSIRLIVIDIKRYEEDEKDPIILFNPEIKDYSGTCKEEEGCLSFPGIRAMVERPEVITVEAIDKNGQNFTLENIDGLISRCIQHEMDHLDGKLFVDKIGDIDKLLLAGRLKKLAKKNK